MSKQEELFNEIAANLPDGQKGKMFGALCIKAPNGKAAVIFKNDEMSFKLQGEDEKEALSLDGAHYFDPKGGRPMRGWVQLPYKYGDRWQEFAAKSMDYVKTLEK